MMIVIAQSYRIAAHWLRDGRLTPDTFVICDRSDCERLLSYELTTDTVIARVGMDPRDSEYIEDFIKARTRDRK